MSITFSIIALASFVLPPNVLLAQSLFSRRAYATAPQPEPVRISTR